MATVGHQAVRRAAVFAVERRHGVAPIDKLSILVTILFSYLVFHEKPSKKAAVGLILVVGGTLLMLF